MGEELSAGTRVRLKSDPGRVGVVTNRKKPQGNVTKYQVMFPDGLSFQPRFELEVVADDSSDHQELILKGQYGGHTDLRGLLTHIQLSGRLTNVMYSMDITNTDFYAYQFKPVLAFLESPSSGLLIADEVGLGKTIEAGLIWTELRARYDLRRLLVVCPAMLREKWRDELQRRFGVDARVVDADELLQILKKDRHQEFDGTGYICSMQGIRPPRGWQNDDTSSPSPRRDLARYIEENAGQEPLVDLVVIDEAHNMRNPDSQTTRLGRLLRDVSENVVLLSATPVNLKELDLFYLLNLVDPEVFSYVGQFETVLRANEPLQKAKQFALNNDKNHCDVLEQLNEARSHKLLQNNFQLKGLLEEDIDFGSNDADANRVSLANRIEKVNLLSHVVNRTRKSEVIEWRVMRDPKTISVELSDYEREFYNDVSQVVRTYASERGISEGFMLASPQRQISSCMYAAAVAWHGMETTDTAIEEMYEDQDLNQEVEHKGGDNHYSPLIERICQSVEANPEKLRNKDTKYEKFRSVLDTYLRDHPDEQVVVFSYFRATLRYLQERLREEGYESIVLVGGMKRSKQEVIDEFRESRGRIRVLLSSEVASEGVDLQFCRLLINYDLPWNPMKIEQRIGRLDRLGQKADKINIINLCYEDTIDQRIYDRLLERLDIFKRSLGGLEAILGEKIRELTDVLICQDLTEAEQDASINQTALAIEQIREDQELLEKQASHLIAHSDYILKQINQAHDSSRRISDQDLGVFVKDYLDKFAPGHKFQQLGADGLSYDVQLPPGVAADFQSYIASERMRSKTRLASGHSVKCRFLNKLQPDTASVETISQLHPLIKFISEDLKNRDSAFFRLVAVSLEESSALSIPAGTYVFAAQRWMFDGLRDEEELRVRAAAISNGVVLDPDKSWELLNRARVDGRSWRAARNEVDPEAVLELMSVCEDYVYGDYQRVSKAREDENHDRIELQVAAIKETRKRVLDTHEGVLADLVRKQQTGLIPARQALIRNAKERFEVHLATLERKRSLTHRSRDGIYGLINVID